MCIKQQEQQKEEFRRGATPNVYAYATVQVSKQLIYIIHTDFWIFFYMKNARTITIFFI